MKLVSMKLKNFRGYKKSKIIFDNQMTTIIGKNDIGKSTIVEALEIFFNNSTVKLDSDDAYIHCDKRDVEIICEFTDVPQNIIIDETQSTNLKDEYLLNENNNLEIKRTYDLSGKTIKKNVYAITYYPTNKELTDILYLNNTKLKKRVSDLDGKYKKNINLNKNSSLRKAIRSSCKIVDFSTKEVDMTKADGKLLFPKIKKYFPSFALFQSDRPSTDSDAEVQDPMHTAIKESIMSEQKELEKIENKVKKDVSKVADATIRKLREMDPEIAKGLKPIFSSVPKWGSLFKFQIEDENGIPLNKRGSGVRRLVLLNFFRAKSDLNEDTNKDIIYAIEEPETSQHPDNQRLIMNSLLELSEHKNCQIIITTHLAETAKLSPNSGIRLIKLHKNRPKVINDENALQDAATEVGLIPNFLNTSVIFYVEGPNDINFFKNLSKKLHNNFPQEYKDFSICEKLLFVPLGGGTLEHWVNKKYLNKLGFPSAYLFDKDLDEKHKKDVEKVEGKDNCFWAGLTEKRELENYISPIAIRRFYIEKYNVDISVDEFNDNIDIPKTIMQSLKDHEIIKSENNIKKELNTKVVKSMTINEFIINDKNNFINNLIKKISDKISDC